MNDENLDIYDEKVNKIGVELRQEVHKKGYWHKTFQCWIISQSGDKRYVHFQKRGPHKTICPNKLDITAAGHLLTGETFEDGIRELNEELGLDIKFNEIIPLGMRCNVAIVGEYIEREFSEVYLCECNTPLNEYKLKIEEVAGVVKIEINEGMKLFSGEIEKCQGIGFFIDEDGKKTESVCEIKADDAIQCLDRYYLKIMIMAERYFNNQQYLAI
ncbi:hypothetical protein LJC22_00940 [Desulfosarcina sp. OttesenSCG-928-G10]|nr:hypothetical protein [Desulfosarcina sp. OttesenSCG-928-G10]